MRSATRIVAGTCFLVALAVLALVLATDGPVLRVPRAAAWVGLVALAGAGLVAALASRAFARALAGLSSAARGIVEGREPEFPDTRVPEVASHAVALRSLAREVALRLDALRRQREEARTLVESMADGVLAADADGAVVTCNAAARRLLGYDGAATVPPLGELFHNKRARDFLRSARSGREVDPVELRIEGREVLASARRLPTGGLALVLRDMTTLRRLETVRRDFVANVSHELKTPLTSIAGYAETLANEPGLDAQARRFAATIVSNAGRMQRLVDDLLDLSRIESGGWRPERQVVELEPAARESWSLLARRATANGLAFETDIEPAARVLSVDPEALRQILTNLLENAVRHTPSGGTIRVTATAKRSGVVLAVTDTGIGIAPEHLPRIFERFYRVDPARSREHGGTGLGLAIVKHLVEGHGGRVEAESTVGRGTVISMTFPT